MTGGRENGGEQRSSVSAREGINERVSPPQADYTAVREAVAVIERSDLAHFRVHGRDPVRMINGLITNDVTQIEPKRAVYAAMLTPKGRVITDMRVITVNGENGRELLLEVPVVAAESVREHFSKYIPPLFARWSMDDEWRVEGLYGPRSPEVVRRLFNVDPDKVEDAVEIGGINGREVRIVASRITGEIGFDLVFRRDAADDVIPAIDAEVENAKGRRIDLTTFDVARVEAGRPRLGIDLSEENFPAEAFETTDLMDRAISFSKGCYTGQEVVVRIAHRGRVNRHLRGLRISGDNLPGVRTPVFDADGEREIGWTASAVMSPRVGGPIALAYIRREVGPGDEVRVGDGGQPARVVDLPFTRTT